MGSPRVRCVLVLPDGASRPVGPGGLIVGRHPDSDLVSADPSASRRHALVRVTSLGAEVVPLGRAPVIVNGAPHDRPRKLADGDVLEMPGLALRVELVQDLQAAADRFVVERPQGVAFGISDAPFSIGGDPADDLILAGWPAAAITFHGHDRPAVEIAVDDAVLGDATVAPGTYSVEAGDVVRCRGETFRIAATGAAAFDTTVAPATVEAPTAVELESLPRGGLVTFTLASGPRAVFLPDRRFDLLVALLQPPGGYQPGEYVGDDLVCTIVWPRVDGAGRTDLNVLISRCRRDLVEAGLDGARLVQRAPRGGGTRFVLARGARIAMKP